MQRVRSKSRVFDFILFPSNTIKIHIQKSIHTRIVRFGRKRERHPLLAGQKKKRGGRHKFLNSDIFIYALGEKLKRTVVRSEDNNLFGMAKSTLEESIVLFEVAICSAATIVRSSSSPFAAKLTKQRFDIFFDLGVILLSRLFVFRDAFNARGKEREKEEEEEEYIVIVDGSLQIKERERERDCFLCCLCVCVCRRTETRAGE